MRNPLLTHKNMKRMLLPTDVCKMEIMTEKSYAQVECANGDILILLGKGLVPWANDTVLALNLTESCFHPDWNKWFVGDCADSEESSDAAAAIRGGIVNILTVADFDFDARM